MTEYQIQANTRRCARTGRELRPGEKYFALLIKDGAHLLRQDFSPEGWQGPPPGAFGYWTGTVPALDQPQKPPVDDDLLLDCLQRLEGETEPGRVNFRYVVALLLMRRKRLKLEQTLTTNGVENMVLRCSRTGERYQVVNPRLSADEMSQVQEEVLRVLGWE
jgi:hypothetical protein